VLRGGVKGLICRVKVIPNREGCQRKELGDQHDTGVFARMLLDQTEEEAEGINRTRGGRF